MPTYEYQCPEGHRFEVFQKMTDEPAASCPTCGVPAQRLISGGAGFLFRGEGFYITDYRSEDYKKKASREVGGAGDSGDGKGGGSGGSGSAGAPSGTGGGGDGGSSRGSSGDKSSSGAGSGSKPASDS